jgi:hypothetical protein
MNSIIFQTLGVHVDDDFLLLEVFLAGLLILLENSYFTLAVTGLLIQLENSYFTLDVTGLLIHLENSCFTLRKKDLSWTVL